MPGEIAQFQFNPENGFLDTNVFVDSPSNPRAEFQGMLDQIKDYLNGNVVANLIPAGAVQPFAMTTPPNGWLKCDGSVVSRTTYSRLFAAIGTTFGTGDGSSTFKLPDLRGEFIRGWDDSKGTDTGRAFGSSQSDTFKKHNHAMRTLSGNTISAGGNEGLVGAGDSSYYGGGVLRYPYPGLQEIDTGSGTETRPRNVALQFCIKY